MPGEHVRPELHRLPGGGVHDARRSHLGDEPRERRRLLLPAPAGLDRERQVGALEAGDEIERVLEAELGGDVGADVRRGGGRERGGGHAQLRAEAGEPPVVGTEIVAPLADAVGLVHDEARRANARASSSRKPLAAQALGCDVQQIAAARPPARPRPRTRSCGARPECSAAAAIPRARSPSTWSFMSAISGDTTTVVPSSSSAGSWKQSDLPAPVGITATRSRPSSTASAASRCPGRKARRPKRSCRARSRALDRDSAVRMGLDTREIYPGRRSLAARIAARRYDSARGPWRRGHLPVASEESRSNIAVAWRWSARLRHIFWVG